MLVITLLLATTSLARGLDPEAASQPVDPFGVYLWADSQLALPGAQEMTEAGASWTNVHLHWSDVESQAGQYNWARWDGILTAATAHGYQVIVTIGGNPSWAADTACGPIRQDNLQAFADFLTAAAARYGSAPYNVRHWALYNEPDNANPVDFPWLGGCWGANHPNAAQGAGGAAYANMLSYAYPAIKAGNPDAQVLLGGLAYEYWYQTDGGPFDYYFLNDLLNAGGAAYFDIANFHYYPAWAWRWADPGGDRYKSNIYGKAQDILSEIKGISGEDKPIACTEVGYPTAGPTGHALAYNEELSSRYVLQVYARAMYTGIQTVIWLEGVDETYLEYSYGLLRSDLTNKQPYDSYRTMVREVAGATSVTARTDYPVNVEGYDFEMRGNTRTALWVLGEYSLNQAFPLALAGGTLRVVDRLGAEQRIKDGGAGDLDGVQDGKVVIAIDANPRIVEDVSGGSYTLSKVLTSGMPARPNGNVTFEITITNTGNTWLAVLPLQDDYDPEYLEFKFADTSPAADDAANDGAINWSDLTVSFDQDLGPGESFAITVTFKALKDTTSPWIPPNGATVNTATVSNILADPDGPVGPLPPDIPLSGKRDGLEVVIQQPTNLAVTDMQVTPAIHSLQVSWRTLNELQLLGFNVLRMREDGLYEVLNEEIIVAEYAGADQGAAYAYLDGTVQPGVTYKYALEFVQSDGNKKWIELDPVTARWWLSFPLVIDH